MKKILLNSLVILGLTSLSAEEFSCSQIVSMNDIEIVQYVKELKKSLDVKNINEEDVTNESSYINEMYSRTAKENRCLLLRDASTIATNDIERVKALALLSRDKRLTYTEKSIYKKALNQSRQSASSYSNASFVSQEACSYPLLYLSGEKTTKGSLLVYEKRLVGNIIKTFSKDMPFNGLLVEYGLNRKIKNNYLKHLNKKGLNLPLLKNPHDIYHPKLNKKREDILDEPYISVTKKFEAVHFQKNARYTFDIGMQVKYDGSDEDEIFFICSGNRYRVSKYAWHRSVKEK